jgi:hypothetical protein
VIFRPGQSAFALLLCRRFENSSWRIAMFSQLRKHDFKEFKPFQSLSPLNALGNSAGTFPLRIAGTIGG